MKHQCTLYINGDLLTDAAAILETRGRPSAFLVQNGRVAAIGATEVLRPDVAASTQIVDLQGRFVMPSFVEPHGHLFLMGFRKLRLDLNSCTSEKALIEAVRREVNSRARGTWISGEGWDQTRWGVADLPTNQRLSVAFPDHPVCLMRQDGHAALCNDLALKWASVDQATADPAGGKILRDPQGIPTGLLLESAMALVTRVMPDVSTETRARALELGLRELARFGITSFHECGANAEEIVLLKKFREDGRLTARMHVMIDGSLPSLLESYLERGPEVGDAEGLLQVRCIKLFADGALGSRGALLFEPYTDDPTQSGVAVIGQVHLEAVAARALERGFQVATHAIGDLANHRVLNAYEKVLGSPSKASDHRFRIEHAQLLAPQDVPRFAKLGVIASMQACHCTSDLPWLEARLGKSRAAERGYLWRSLLASGALVVNGSDAPIESPNPFWGMYAAMTRRRREGGPWDSWQPEQTLNASQAFHAATLAAAYAGFSELEFGSLAVGKWADFIVLAEDPFNQPPEALLTTQVEETFLGGRSIYQQASE